MAGTGILIAPHGAALTNTMFMPQVLYTHYHHHIRNTFRT